MDRKSLNKFVLRCLVAILPLIIILSAYIVLDPFRVVRNHDPFYVPGSPLPYNKGYASTMTYLNGRERWRYNAFIFGTSRTIYLPADEWARHLGPDASVYHFDAPSDTPSGIADKLRLIDRSGDSIRYALIEIAPWALGGNETNDFAFRRPWQLTGTKALPHFHYSFVRDFFRRSMFVALMRYYATGRIEEQDKKLFQQRSWSDNPVNNETINDSIEHLIATDPGKFYDERAAQFAAMPKTFHYCDVPITEPERKALVEIAGILRRHHTDYRIFIGPEIRRTLMSPESRRVLDSIFEPSRIIDLSLYLPAFTEPMAFYDQTHFRPFIGKMLLDTMYRVPVNPLPY
ncbi:MAG: hypothetical protein NC117_05030 [Pseudoflavonifractor sp.]|nr:hypothetical protein [Pseudoflavonifractor sp.]